MKAMVISNFNSFDKGIMEVLGPLFAYLEAGIPISDDEPTKRDSAPSAGGNGRPKPVKIHIDEDAGHRPAPVVQESLRGRSSPDFRPWREVRLPGISSVKFTGGIERSEDGDVPTTVTRVDFADGTYTVVKRHPSDAESKENAVAYCILKRVFGTVGAGGEVSCKNLFTMLHGHVKGASYQYRFDGELSGKQDGGCHCGEADGGCQGGCRCSGKPIRDSKGRFIKRS